MYPVDHTIAVLLPVKCPHGAGQFEHTLIIVDEGADLTLSSKAVPHPNTTWPTFTQAAWSCFYRKNARLRYSTIENWSKNMYNLNTKRAQVEEGGAIEWVSGSFGSHVSYSVPDEHSEGPRRTDGIYRRHLCRQRPGPGYRRQGGPCQHRIQHPT